jgi:hypothetical protein
MNTYSHEQKEKLARKINKIKNKQKLIDILKIIQKDELYGGITENDNGLFMLFHKLNDETYFKIEKILKKNIKTTSDNPNTEPYTDSAHTESYNENTITSYSADNYQFDNQSRLKYSNKEKNIIKRKLYDDALNDIANENNINNDNNLN